MDELRSRLVQHLSALSAAHLSDFDWSLRVRACLFLLLYRVAETIVIVQLTVATSKLSKLREPLLLLTLNISFVDGSSRAQTLELTKEDLDTFLSHLGKISEVRVFAPLCNCHNRSL